MIICTASTSNRASFVSSVARQTFTDGSLLMQGNCPVVLTPKRSNQRCRQIAGSRVGRIGYVGLDTADAFPKQDLGPDGVFHKRESRTVVLHHAVPSHDQIVKIWVQHRRSCSSILAFARMSLRETLFIFQTLQSHARPAKEKNTAIWNWPLHALGRRELERNIFIRVEMAVGFWFFYAWTVPGMIRFGE